MATAQSSDSSILDFGGPAGSPPRIASLRRRGLAITFGLVVAAAAILGATSAPAPASADAVPGSVTQCNGVDNQGGRAVECEVTITNYLDVATGLSSSVIVVRSCSNFAGEAPTCTTLPASFPTATTVVDQCNGSGTGGGATVTCRVDVTNIITGDTTLSPATVYQCFGSGAEGTEPTLNCSTSGSTADAVINQCNGSANGGGAARRVTCTVEPSTTSTALPISINQCNGSAAGGSLVTCTASLTHQILAVEVPGESTPPPVVIESPAPVDTSAPSATPSPLLPVSGGGGTGNGLGSELAETGMDAQPVFLVAAGALLIGGVLVAVMLLRRRPTRVAGAPHAPESTPER